jgi:hypothetical protein
MTTTRYTSNNSGGHWWLKDEDWFNLAAAGWTVSWIAESEFYGGRGSWLGALAREATRDLPEAQAIAEFERITGQYAGEEGCSCCGEPHYFHEEN